MALPLAACVIALFSFQASAQPPEKTADDPKAALARHFSDGTDVASLDFSNEPPDLVSLRDQAKDVQAGRAPGEEAQTYVALIRAAALSLGSDPNLAVKLYENRVSTSHARAAIIPDDHQDAQRSLKATARVQASLQRIKKQLESGQRAIEPLTTGAAADTFRRSPQNANAVLPQVQPLSLPPIPAPPLPATLLTPAMSTDKSWEYLTPYVDSNRGASVAASALTGTLKYVDSMGKVCYTFVIQALIEAGIINVKRPENIGDIGLRTTSAAMFSQDVAKNPAILDKMGYRQADLAKIGDAAKSIPEGSLLIYAPGCSWASPEHGHAEITVGTETYDAMRAKNKSLKALNVGLAEVRACHYECMPRSTAFLRTYGKQGCLKMYVPVKPA